MAQPEPFPVHNEGAPGAIQRGDGSDAGGVQTRPAALEMENVTKFFGTVQILHDVDFNLRAGEIHGLVGENGAGKSTLVGIIAGDYTDFGGTMSVFGRAVHFANARTAQDQGVVLIHQEPTGLPTLSVAENILAGRLPSMFGIIRQGELYRQAEAALGELGIEMNVRQPLSHLSPAQRQLVEIARAFLQSPKVLILDEPTASLDAAEAERLFAAMDRLRKRGASILFISHHLPEILAMCDRVTVLRDGRRIDTLDTRTTTEDQLAMLMVGRELAEVDQLAQRERAIGDPVLRVEHLSVGNRLQDVSLTLHRGEVLGVTGLLGAGQDELIRALFGMESARGEMMVRGERYRPGSPVDALQSRIALLTDDRQGSGLILDESNRQNLALASSLRRGWAVYRRSEELSHARQLINLLDVHPPQPDRHVGTLSGGNQQKIALGKWLRGGYEILILHEPTRGVDVGAKALIHREVVRLADEGMAVLLTSSDLREITALSDRVLVLHRGTVAGSLEASEASEDRLLTLAAGVGHDGREAAT